MMLRTVSFAAVVAILAWLPAAADPSEDGQPIEKNGLSGLLEKYGPQLEDLARKMQDEGLRDLWEQLEPRLKDLQRDMQPALEEGLKLMEPFRAMDDPRHYEFPEVLPNGDIIIRRRDDAPAYEVPQQPETEPQPDGSIKT